MDRNEKVRVLRGLNMGDLVRCSNGKVYEFVRMKQAKFIGKFNGTSFDIPLEMFVTIEERVEKAPFDVSSLREGELFYILDNKQQATLFRFKYMINAHKVMATNPITDTGVRISAEMVEGTVRELQNA